MLAVSGLLLAACGSAGPGGRSVLPTATMDPTPTLLVGLPTSTATSETLASGSSETRPSLAVTPAPRPTATDAPNPTATPLPEERPRIGQELLAEENFSAAAEQFRAGLQSGQLAEGEQQSARLGLAVTQLRQEDYAAAAETLGQVLASAATAPEAEDAPGRLKAAGSANGWSDAYFFLAQAHEGLGDCEAAIGAYQSFLTANADLAAYVQPRIAACYLTLGDRPAAIAALAQAVMGDALPETEVALREQLAQMYVEDGQYQKAIEQYNAILTVTTDEPALGRATYLAGSAFQYAGDPEAAYVRFEQAVNSYPKAYESYLALSQLVEAGRPVDEFQRGLVDFYARAYAPAVAAFDRYVATNPTHREDAHLYLAWSYEGQGDIESALREIDAYIEAVTPTEPADQATPAAGYPSPDGNGPDPGDGQAEGLPTDAQAEAAKAEAARGWLERAKLQTRADRLTGAISDYLIYVERFPAGADAPLAAWYAAALTERLGELETAARRYQALVEGYPEHEDAAESLFRAGYLNWQLGEETEAVELWRRGAEQYAEQTYGAASLVWLLKMLPEEEREPYLSQASKLSGEDYYTQRALDIAADREPFQRAEQIELTVSAEDQAKAEAWLGERFGLEDAAAISALPASLAGDGRLTRGEKLWRLGLRPEAKQELESLRASYAEDPIGSYQLALFFRDLGLYRSSILAATSVMREAGVDIFGAPPFLGQLVYPTHYANLILGETSRYGIDPLLQFALVRQESLFESFATSSAVAQGLSQVIPETGAYIAERLEWPDYQNEHLYRPYVGVAFGAFYLAQQLATFGGDTAAALAAYNGGPGNAARWHQAAPDDLDRFVEGIDFWETRQYVQRIYAGQAIYRHLYGR